MQLGNTATSLITQLKNWRLLANLLAVGLIAGGAAGYNYVVVKDLGSQKASLQSALESELKQTKDQLTILESKDFVVLNKQHEEELSQLQKLYERSNYVYEKIQEFEDRKIDIVKHLELFAVALKQISDKDYTGADATLTEVEKLIKEQLDKDEAERVAQQKADSAKAAAEAAAKAAAAKATAPIAQGTSTNNTPAGSGYQVQSVSSSAGTFQISYVAADLNSTRVVVDTASPNDCDNDCPVLPLADYVNRNGAYAGINGTYFCPTAYPQCAGKANTFDPLLLNKEKVWVNGGNKLYSIYPVMLFRGTQVTLVSRAVDMAGLDTSYEAGFSNFPLLLVNGQQAFYGNNDSKMMSKGMRCFLASKGSSVYIGCIHNANLVEATLVLQAMGMTHAINLDSGGSTALWSGGYKLGPGRALPNAILFVRR